MKVYSGGGGGGGEYIVKSNVMKRGEIMPCNYFFQRNRCQV